MSGKGIRNWGLGIRALPLRGNGFFGIGPFYRPAVPSGAGKEADVKVKARCKYAFNKSRIRLRP